MVTKKSTSKGNTAKKKRSTRKPAVHAAVTRKATAQRKSVKKAATARKPANPAAAKAPAKPAPAKPANKKKVGRRAVPKTIRVVAIGASAGGLEPIEQFFEAMPANSGLSFVVIQHLSPDFRSMMDQLIARHSSMKILHAEQGMKIEPNTLYLNPPRTDLTISDGRLQLSEQVDPEALSLPIDTFFKSLALDQKEKAIGIILSGTGSDGARGGLEIRDAGGTVIVQDPATAKFDGMPRTAVQIGAATICAEPRDMPDMLRRLVGGEELGFQDELENPETDPEGHILSLLQRRFGADFGYYKQATVGRRIRRRALLNQVGDLSNYAEMLAEDNNELEALYCDLLIGVTAFFRDQEAFDLVAEKLIPDIAADMSDERQIRVWSPGCASGEEPYSLAILFAEYARLNDVPLNVKIFATDLHFNSLEIAARGVYPVKSLEGIDDELIARYFDKIGNKYRIKQLIRRLVVFSPHNLIKDPPFTRMDLVTCRNLLIYLDDTAQKKVLALFHYALRPAGILFLGPSETAGDLGNEFETLNKRWRMFRKIRDVRLREAMSLLPLRAGDEPAAEQPVARLASSNTLGTAPGFQAKALQRQSLMHAYDVVLDKYAPASLLVDREGTLIHVFGDADNYIRVGRGAFTQNVIDVLHPELKMIVSAGLERARLPQNIPFRRSFEIERDDGEKIGIVVSIERLGKDGTHADYLLVSFEEKKKLALETAPTDVSAEDSDIQDFWSQRANELERELRFTEESLQSTVQELETSNEEMQASNEELIASNEELQSTNEELHSVNEELYTVSTEHQLKIEELTELTDDMDNLLRSTDIGTIFLDSELRIRRFTPAAARTFNLLEHDLGRPIEHITTRFEHASLIDDIKSVRDGGRQVEEEISVDDRAYLVRILPYRSTKDQVSGAVITIIDINALKTIQGQLAKQEKLYAEVVNQQQDLITRCKPDTTLTFVNEAYCRFYGKKREELLGTKFVDYIIDEDRDEVTKSIAELKPGEVVVNNRRSVRSDGEIRWMRVQRYIAEGSEDGALEIQNVAHDITELREAQDELDRERQRLESIVESQEVFVFRIDTDHRLTYVNPAYADFRGKSEEELLGTVVYDWHTEENRLSCKAELDSVEPGQRRLSEVKIIQDNGEARWFGWLASTILNDRGQIIELQALGLDITDLKMAQLELEQKNIELARINDNLEQFTHIVSHDLTGPLRAIGHTAEWIEQDASPQPQAEIQEHIDRLKDQVSHLESMLADLMDYSRAGSSQQAAEPIDLKHALTDIFDVIEKPEGMKLVLETLPDDCVTLRAPLMLAFRNLIENAVKYHDRESGEITVSCEDHGDSWMFEVADDGPGIDPHFHEKILLPFRKLERKDKAPGNGMGLALVKKAIESNGGKLVIKSNPLDRPGTTFQFSWPKNRTLTTAAA